MNDNSKKKKRDYARALTLYHKFKSIRVEGKLICNRFFLEDYNLWHNYRQAIFNRWLSFTEGEAAIPQRSASYRKNLQGVLVDVILCLYSLISVLFSYFKRPSTLLYSVDKISYPFKSDFRAESIYKFLEEKKISYIEIFHTIPSLKALGSIFRRGRAAIYLESFDLMYSTFSFFKLVNKQNRISFKNVNYQIFDSEDERKYAERLVSYYAKTINVSIFKINLIRKIFKVGNIKFFFSIDDMRFMWDFLLAAKFSSVKSAILQHGQYSQYHVGFLKDTTIIGKTIAPDLLLVQNYFWKNELFRLGTFIREESIVVALQKDPPLFVDKKPHKKINILVPYEASSPMKEMGDIIKRLVADNNCSVYFKIRSDRRREGQIEDYGLDINGVLTKLSVVSNMEGVWSEIDVVLGSYSTFLYEAIMVGRPVIIMSQVSDYGSGLIKNSLAEGYTKSSGDLVDFIRQTKDMDKNELLKRRVAFVGEDSKSVMEVLSEFQNSRMDKN